MQRKDSYDLARKGGLAFLLPALSFLLLFISGGEVSAEFYKVEVQRVASNVYKDVSSGVYIQTRSCTEFCHGEEAVLVYNDPAYENRLIFPGGKACEVTALFE